jgi:hypothetical protein
MDITHYIPSLRPPDRLVPSASPPPTESIKRKRTEVNPWRPQFRRQHHPLIEYPRRPGVNLVLGAVLLNEIMKTSDPSAVSIVVPQVVAMDAFGAN